MTNKRTTNTSQHITPTQKVDYDQYAQQLLADWPGNELYAANLLALKHQNLKLAQRLADLQLPANAKLTVARDGSVTYQLIQEDGTIQWLGFSSMPMVSARANAKRTEIKSGNIAMNGINHGQDAKEILNRLNHSQALFVIENNIHNIAMALRLRDFTSELTRGKLILLFGNDPVKLITEFFARHNGYNIIEQALKCSWLDNKENQRFNQTISSAITAVAQTNNQKINRLLTAQKDMPTPNDTFNIISNNKLSHLRVINFTNCYTPQDYTATRDILSAMAKLGITTDHLILNRPDIVSPTAQLERFEKTKPHIIILIDKLREDFSLLPPPSCLCLTILTISADDFLATHKDFDWENHNRHNKDITNKNSDNDNNNSNITNNTDKIIVFTESDKDKLVQAGAHPNAIIVLNRAANNLIFRQVKLTPDDIKRYSSDVAYTGSRFTTDPEKYNIMLPTIQNLWYEIYAEIQKKPAKYSPQNARMYIKNARLRSVNIHDEELLNTLEQLTKNYLAPVALTEAYLQSLVNASVNLKIWSWGELGSPLTDKPVPYWNESPLKDRVWGTVDYNSELNKLFNAAKIHIYITTNGQIEPYLLNGIAAGAFFLVRATPNDRKPGYIGSIFKLGKELISFDTLSDLQKKVHFYLKNDSLRQQIALAAQKKVLAKYTYQHAVKQMLNALAAEKKRNSNLIPKY